MQQTLHYLAAELGGDVYAGGRQVSIPGPGHGRNDRSASLTLGRNNKILAYSHSDSTDWRDILRYLLDKDLITPDGKPKPRNGAVVSRSFSSDDKDKATAVRDIWTRSQDIENTLSERYVRETRCVSMGLKRGGALRHCNDIPVSAYARHSRYNVPGLLVGITGANGSLKGVEIHYLDGQARLNSRLNIPRKTIGNYEAGWSVQVDEPAEEMVVGTGIFSTLSASQYFALPCQAMMSDKNLRNWRPSPITRRVIIAGDNDTSCRAAIATLLTNLNPYDLHVSVKFAPDGHNDFNDFYRWETRHVRH